MTRDNQVVATFDSQQEAAEESTELAGFEVLTVEGLPDGFAVSGFEVPTGFPGAAVRRVQVAVESDTGGLLVEQLNSRAAIDGADELDASEPGDYLRRQTGRGFTYYLVTDDRTFTISTQRPDTLTDEEALRVLTQFASRL
ncbi:MAG: hypothetical protein ACRDHF_07945 [Tepidiformaceae bacterium]